VSGLLLVFGVLGFFALVGLHYLGLTLQQPTVVVPSTKEVSSIANIDTAFISSISNVGAGLVATALFTALI
jgi:hypothetical protein